MYIDALGMVNCDSLKAKLTKQLFTMVTSLPRSRRAWVHYGRPAKSSASCISCTKKTGWQTNHLSLQALRLTNKEITAFSEHKQGKFLRYYDHSRWYSIKVFIAHILVLLSLKVTMHLQGCFACKRCSASGLNCRYLNPYIKLKLIGLAIRLYRKFWKKMSCRIFHDS